MAHKFARVSVMALSLLLTACGGGGGSSAPTPPPPAADTTPPAVSFAVASATVESAATLTSAVTASDNVGVTTGPDVTCTNGGSYSGDVFTAPTVAAETQSVCTATASDAAGNSASATLTVTITPPPDMTPPTVSFSPDTGTVESGGTLTSALTATDNVAVTVGPNVMCTAGSYSGDVFTAPTVTSQGEAVCTATVEDTAGNSASATLTVTITPPANQAPSFTGQKSFTVAENQPFRTAITVTDEQDDIVSVQIRGGRDAQYFSYDDSAKILELNQTLAGNDGRNFEIPGDVGLDNVYEVELLARDSANNFVVEVYSLTITNVDEGLALTGKVTLDAGPDVLPTTYQRHLASLGDWTGDGFSELMIARGEFSSNRTIENIFLMSGEDVYDTPDSNISVLNQENGIRILFGNLDTALLMSARQVPDLSGDGLMDIYLKISGSGITRGFILDSAKLLPLLDNGELTWVDIYTVEAEGFGIEITPQGTAEDVSEFLDDLEFIPDLTGDGRPDLLHCQAVPNSAGGTRNRNLVLGSEAFTSALGIGTGLTVNIDSTAPALTQPNLVFMDTQQADSNFTCAQSMGDFDADGKNDLQFSGEVNATNGAYVTWGQTISDLLPTGGVLPLETLTDTGNGIVFTPGFGVSVGDLDANGFAELIVSVPTGNNPDPEVLFEHFYIYGATQSLLDRFPSGVIDTRSMQTQDRDRRTTVRIFPNEYTQFFADGEPLDLDNDGRLDWMFNSRRLSGDSFASQVFHVEPQEQIEAGLSPYFGAISNFAEFIYRLDFGTIDTHNLAYAKDITDDGTADLLGSHRGQPFIVSGERLLELVDEPGGAFPDFSELFPELYD